MLKIELPRVSMVGHGLKKGFIGMLWIVSAAVMSACSPSALGGARRATARGKCADRFH